MMTPRMMTVTIQIMMRVRYANRYDGLLQQVGGIIRMLRMFQVAMMLV